MSKQKPITYDDLWSYFDYEDRLEETANQILRIADKSIDKEELRDDLNSLVKIVADTSYMHRLIYADRDILIKHWTRDLMFYSKNKKIGDKIFFPQKREVEGLIPHKNPKVEALTLLTATMIYNIVKDYGLFIDSYFKKRL